jgi:hypothetical protein
VASDDLTEDLRTRVTEATKREILEECERQERTEANLVRRYIRQGLERDRARRDQEEAVT